MSDARTEWLLPDAEATAALGAVLARGWSSDAPGARVLHLHGELGAGKTTCVRGLLRALGVTGSIRSPTYTLVETYEVAAPTPGAAATCVHVDLYRLVSPAETDALGLRDYWDYGCLMLVEWPEKGDASLPPADVDLTLSYAGEQRQARVTARSAPGREWLRILQHDTSLSSYLIHLT